VKVRCSKCGYVWDYRGTNTYWATCPRCLRKVKLGELRAGGEV